MNRPMTRALPFPTHRLCRVGISLLSVGTMKELRRLAVHPARFVSSRVRTSVSIRFCSFCGDASTECQDVVQPVSSHSGLLGGEASPPIFPGNPLVPMLRSSTPTRPSCLGLSLACWCCPPSSDSVGSGDLICFVAQFRSLGTRCLRFVPSSQTTTQDSLAGADQAFLRGICSPDVSRVDTRRVPVECFSCCKLSHFNSFLIL